MKLKTKAKILSGLLGISSTLGVAASNITYAAQDAAEVEHHDDPRPTARTEHMLPAEMHMICERLLEESEHADVRNEINRLREDVITGRIVMDVAQEHRMLDMEAARAGNIRWVETHFDWEDASDVLNAFGAAQAYWALTHDQTLMNHITQYIRDNNVNLDNAWGRALLRRAAACGGDACENLVRFLLEERHTDPNSTNTETGDTALHYAVLEGRGNIVNILLDHRADPTIANNRGLTPYAMATAQPSEITGIATAREPEDLMRRRNAMADILLARGINH